MTTRSVLLTLVAALVLLAGACSRSDRSAEAETNPNPRSSSNAVTASAPSTTEAAFKVEGMHCATCPVTVRAAAKSVAGVLDARVSMDKDTAWVTYDPARTDPAKIAAAITESGYPARVLRGDQPSGSAAERPAPSAQEVRPINAQPSRALEPLFDATLRYTSESPEDAVIPSEGEHDTGGVAFA
jgi:mercuric ion binding protein